MGVGVCVQYTDCTSVTSQIAHFREGVHNQAHISIGSATFAGLVNVSHTHSQTHRQIMEQ